MTSTELKREVSKVFPGVVIKVSNRGWRTFVGVTKAPAPLLDGAHSDTIYFVNSHAIKGGVLWNNSHLLTEYGYKVFELIKTLEPYAHLSVGYTSGKSFIPFTVTPI